MKLSNKFYDVLKWIVITGLPVVAFFLAGLSEIYGWDLTSTVALVNLVTAALGMLIGISSIKYNKDKE